MRILKKYIYFKQFCLTFDKNIPTNRKYCLKKESTSMSDCYHLLGSILKVSSSLPV